MWVCACLCTSPRVSLLATSICIVFAPLQCVVHQEEASQCVCPPLFDTGVYRSPVRTEPLLGTSHPCVSPPPSPSAYPAYHVSPGNAPPPFLPPSLPHQPPVTAVWAFITPLPPSSFYLSARIKESVKEYVWGRTPYVHNCPCVCVCGCVRTYVTVCVHGSLSVQVCLCICD